MRLGSWKARLGMGALFGMLLICSWTGLGHQAHAEYVENNLIDDNIYLDAASMSQDNIRTFLLARGGFIGTATFWSDRDNTQVPAYQIVYEAAQDYGINPKVILSTMQKEESLVTDPNPLPSQVRFAMGYGCGDSSGCASYPGFFKQVDNATWQLRFNFERARGNNSWWNANLGYPCNGATRYYSAALKPGNWVTFYNESGAPYKSFTINNAATASLYCYTPHAYSQYYTGSYNFVYFFELWFGSTQPAVVVTSPLRISGLNQGVFTNTPVTVSFDMRNNYNWPVGIGGMAVALRDQNGGNHDFGLQQVTIPAHGTYTYTSTQTLSTESTYNFWITNFNNNSSGAWSDTIPVSSNIDNARNIGMWVPAMPTLTLTPTTAVTDPRAGRAMGFTYKIKNNSSAAMDLGKTALAIRGPNGTNYDLPVHNISLAANTEYAYTDSLIPSAIGTYNTYVTITRDGGQTWNETNWPANATGVQRSMAFTVKQSPTITQSPALNIGTPRVGQQVATSFKVKNFSDAAVNVGKIGLAIRGPNGENLDRAAVAQTIASNTEYTFASNATFQTPGTYTMWVTDTRDNGATWDDTTYPAPEDGTIARRIQFTVLPSPTVTVQPTVTTATPRAGGTTTATFTMHNYGDSSVTVGGVALAVRGPSGNNADFGLQQVTIAAGQDYTYTMNNVFQTPGTYTMWLTSTRDGGQTWNDTTYPVLESSSLNRSVQFVVMPNPTITQGPALGIPSPHANQATTATFSVQNFTGNTVPIGKIGLAIRGPQSQNVDAGAVPVTLNPNSTYTFSAPVSFTAPGTYTMWITDTVDNGVTWNDTTYPALESGAVLRRIQFVVQP